MFKDPSQFAMSSFGPVKPLDRSSEQTITLSLFIFPGSIQFVANILKGLSDVRIAGCSSIAILLASSAMILVAIVIGTATITAVSRQCTKGNCRTLLFCRFGVHVGVRLTGQLTKGLLNFSLSTFTLNAKSTKTAAIIRGEHHHSTSKQKGVEPSSTKRCDVVQYGTK
jgi:hypothetical protein